MPNLIIGSRGSRLALWQANWIKSELERLHDGLTVEIEIIKTTGDTLTEASLSRMPGKGVFTKEIEEALLDHRIDLAVHSLKDLPTTLPEGLHLGAVTKREDPRDALIVNRRLTTRVNSISSLPVQPRIGTSSPRRASQIKNLRPDAQTIELRGNVETRLRKLEEGAYDAIILAAAGLNRLGYSARITQLIPVNQLLPAVGQGALGIETRIEDERTNFLIEGLNHWPTRNAVEAERALLRGLGGGCAVPIAAYGQVGTADDSNSLRLEALVCNTPGTKMVRHDVTGSQYKSEEIGSLLARHLIAAGAYELLNESGAYEMNDEVWAEAPVVARTSVKSNSPGENNTATRTAPETSYEPILTKQAIVPPVEESYFEEIPAPALVEEKIAAPHTVEAKIAAPAAVGEIVIPADPQSIQAAPPQLEEQPVISTPDDFPQPEIAPLPLAGQRIIVTRARHQADALAQSLQTCGAEVVVCPTIEIRSPDNWSALDQAILNLRNYQWLVFTSSNGVNYFLRRFDELQHGRAELAALKICAVGKKTAEKLLEENLQVDLTPEKFTAESLVAAFIRKFGVGQRMRGTRMLLPAAKATRDVIRPTLEKLGVTVDVVEAYQNVLPDVSGEEVVSLISGAQASYVVFTSPSTVSNLSLLLDSDHLAAHLAKTRIACIGPVTAQAAERCGLTVHIQPDEHTVAAIVAELIKDCQP